MYTSWDRYTATPKQPMPTRNACVGRRLDPSRPLRESQEIDRQNPAPTIATARTMGGSHHRLGFRATDSAFVGFVTSVFV